MGLFKIALIGGAGYLAGKKMNERKHQQQQQQQQSGQGSRCSQMPQRPDSPSHQQQSYQQSRQPGDADSYYNNTNNNLPAYNEKQQQYLEYQQPQRSPHEKPLQLNFVEPKKGAYADAYPAAFPGVPASAR